jgi:class 3 adenylate cyclase/SAM-dependent methyltransferase
VSRERISAIAHATLAIQNPITDAALGTIIEACCLGRGDLAVDIGCGTGEFLAGLVTRWHCRGLGIDRSPFAIERARQRSSAVEWRVDDGRTPGVAPGSAGLVASVGATHVFGSLTGTLASILPLVRPNGFVVLGEGYWREPPTDEWLADLGASRNELCDRRALLAEVASHGVRIEETFDAAPADIDRYNDAWRENLEQHLHMHPDDPEASDIAAALDHARRWHPLSARYLGFTVLVARRLLPPRDDGSSTSTPVVRVAGVVDEPERALAADLDRLRAAGLYDPSSPTASERAELLGYLLDLFSVDEIVSWSQRTNMFGIAARAIDRPPPLVSATEVAKRANVPLETVLDLRATVGFPVVDADAPSLPETVVDDVKTFVLGCELYGRDEALAFARVLGWVASRVMEAARAMFAGSIVRMDDESRTELQLAKNNEAGIVAWMQVQSVMHHLLAEQPLRNVGFAEALLRGELQAALAFVDLVSSTTWAESVGFAEHSEALRRFELQSSTLAANHGARLVKLIGDEAMLVGGDPAQLCGAAVAICELAHADPVLPDARGAVGFGLVTARDGDYFGSLVNIVARASKLASPGEIVVTADVAVALDPGRWSVESIGLQDLRGVSDKVYLSRVGRLRTE